MAVRKSGNLYAYHQANLLLSYGLGILSTLIASILGLLACARNGTGQDTALSSMLYVFRHADLTGPFGNVSEIPPLPKGIAELAVKQKDGQAGMSLEIIRRGQTNRRFRLGSWFTMRGIVGKLPG